MRAHRLWAIARKETIQIRRDPRSLLIVIALPLLLLFTFGYAISLDIRHLPLCLLDREGSQRSQDLLKRFGSSRYFEVTRVAKSYRELVGAVDDGTCTMAIVVPLRYSELLREGKRVSVQALVDASDGNTAEVSIGYAEAVIGRAAGVVQRQELERHGILHQRPPLVIEARTWFNENLESMSAIVPGVVAIVMAVVGTFLTALTIAREWERGTMEQLVSTPVTPLELLLGKLSPYFVIGMFDTIVCTVLAVVWFDVPFRGSLLALFIGSALFLEAVLALGYVISVVARSQLAASQVSLVVTFLPSFLLSGFIFPIEQMPAPIRALTAVFPARYYVSLLRDVFLKDNPIRWLAPDLGVLFLFALVLTAIATRVFHKTAARR